jgi:transposase InsO family protein
VYPANHCRRVTHGQAFINAQRPCRPLPYRVHTVLTEKWGAAREEKAGAEAYKPHIFDVVRYRNGIEHRLTKAFHPWLNGQVERMNRTIKK